MALAVTYGTRRTSSPGKELGLRCHSMPACFPDGQGMVEVKPNRPAAGLCPRWLCCPQRRPLLDPWPVQTPEALSPRLGPTPPPSPQPEEVWQDHAGSRMRYAGHGVGWVCPLSILINSLIRGPLMKQKVLIPLRGVASTGTGSLHFGGNLREARPRRCSELPGGGASGGRVLPASGGCHSGPLGRPEREGLGGGGCWTGQRGVSRGPLPLGASWV